VNKKQATAKADKLFSLRVREVGVCFAAGYGRVRCGGSLQCCHILTRARRSLRWDDENALAMCAGHHVWFTHNVDAFREFVKSQGIDYDALHRRSESAPPMDPYEVVERLRGVGA
jgi:hypothetical protein